MQPFKLIRPQSLHELLTLLAEEEDLLLWGGGTSSTILMKQNLLLPTTVAALKGVRELYGLERLPDGTVRIGAMTTLRELEHAAWLADLVPSVGATATLVGNVRVRNVATLGGHLVHADPAQDLPPLLLVLGAQVRLRSLRGERVLDLDEFFVDLMETAIQPDEVLVDVTLPAAASELRARYVKFRPQSQEDYGVVGVAASVAWEADGRTARTVKLAVGGAGPTARRFREAEERLQGREWTPALLAEVAEWVRSQVEPWDDARGSASYKREMAAVWARRVLASLQQQAETTRKETPA
ncbi:MAG: xanthine dehydrogenase family protein subunit M [Alicyclobacillus sp.]|nr:xanthine dehydrogenase family protein subunit M [Alicyclobacillus sp.]